MVSASDLKVFKTTNNLGGAITGTSVSSGIPNNVFSNVPKNELTLGEDYYACVIFKNNHPTEAMDNFKLWLSNKSFPLDTELKWGFDPIYSKSIAFDGVNDYIDCTNDANLWSQGLTKFSFSFWIFPTGMWDGNFRVTLSHGSGNAHSFIVLVDDNVTGQISFTIWNSSANPFISLSSSLVPNAWNNVVCVYDNSLGSANVKIYVNGVLGAITANLTETINNSSILALANSITGFKGYMKDFRWWTTKALTQTEINDVYSGSINAPSPDYWLKMDEGTGNPVDKVSSTKVGTLTNGATWTTVAQTIADKYTSPLNVTWKSVSGPPSTSDFAKLTASSTFPVWLWLHVNANAEARLDDNAIFNFRFNIPTGGTGTPGGGSGGDFGTYHYEPFGTFNGTSDKVDEPDAASLDLTEFSIAVWFRTTKNYHNPTATDPEGEEGILVVKGKHTGHTSPFMNYGIWVTDHNGLRGGFRTSTGLEYMANSLILRQYNESGAPDGPGSNDGLWHLGVVTFDGQTVKLYFDSVLHASVSAGGATGDLTSTPLRIGANNFEYVGPEELGPNQYFKGDIDEVYVWNNDLTQQEITDLFNSGTVPQSSAIVYSNTFGGSSGTGGGGGTGGNPLPTTPDYKIAISGDWGCEPETNDMIDLIQTEDYDYVVGVGDNAYESASCWTGRFDVLLPNFNSAYGNHEYSETGGTNPYKTFFGHSQTYFSFKFENIFFLVVDTNIDSDPGSNQYNFIANALTQANNDPEVTWKIAIMHHPWYGASSDHSYNEFNQRQNFHTLFQNNGVRFVVTGHNHNSQRTHQLAYNSSSSGNPNVVDNTSPYSRSTIGLIHVVSGTGGHDTGGSLYDLGSQPSYQAYQNNTRNQLWEIVATNGGNTLTCSFVDFNRERYDTFVITA